MTEKEIYKELAQRYIFSAEQHIVKGINVEEVIAFMAYHAFECLCSAVIVDSGQNPSRKHKEKLSNFLTLCRNNFKNQINSTDLTDISQMIVALENIRNKLLYPESQAGNIFKSPKEQIILTDAQTLVQNVANIIQKILKII
ncbi:hypothetical protein [Synechocystis sp. PCC 7509]|uniref:hypothetical protein n=1 Tax=Synechocystis sp. PCC 7509 TaxID=927677 RepID=UPI0002AC8F83|nr:hypothetical protein [Synechocystis sp. PCC 7509]